MKLSHLGICIALTGGAALCGLAWLSSGAPSAVTRVATNGGSHDIEVVRQVARSFESMARAGQDLPVPEPQHLKTASSPPPSAAWEDSVAKLGITNYANEIQSLGDSSAASVSVQKLLVINHVGNSGFPEGAREFAGEAFAELQARPEETVQSISGLLNALPSDRTEERDYLLHLAALLDTPASATHSEVTSLLRVAVDQGLTDNASAELKASAASAAIQLAHLGEPLPDVSSLAHENAPLSQLLERQPAAAPSSQP